MNVTTSPSVTQVPALTLWGLTGVRAPPSGWDSTVIDRILAWLRPHRRVVAMATARYQTGPVVPLIVNVEPIGMEGYAVIW